MHKIHPSIKIPSSKRQTDWSWASYSVRLCDTTGASFTQNSHKAKGLCPLLTVSASETSWLEQVAPSVSYRWFQAQLLEFFHRKESRSDHSGGQDPTLAACISENRGKHGGLNVSGPGQVPDLLHILIPQLIRPERLRSHFTFFLVNQF